MAQKSSPPMIFKRKRPQQRIVCICFFVMEGLPDNQNPGERGVATP